MPGGTDAQMLMRQAEVEETLSDLARRIHAGPEGPSNLLLVGVRRRGVELAHRIAKTLRDLSGQAVQTGSLDISLYRDDFAQIGPRPVIGSTELPGEITGRRVVIVDDVLYTGRTVRAALNELEDFGRPGKVELCVLVDRGGRELPIQADYVGRFVEVPPGREVAVRVPELDGEFSVSLVVVPTEGS